MDGTGEDGAENVVRLPREWVGPPEELVPMGSRARAQERDEAIPAADDFWGEGAAAVHGAIQPPSRDLDRSATPPRVRLRPPARRAWGFSVRPPVSRVAATRFSIRPRVVATVLAIAVVVAVAAIGLTEGSGGQSATGARATGMASVSRPFDARQLGPASGGRPISGLLNSAQIARTELEKREARQRAAARRRRVEQARAARNRRRRARKHRAATGSANSTVSSTGSTPTTPTQTTAPTTNTTPTETSAGSSGSSGTHASTTHHSAFGQSGLLGAGHSSGDS